MLVINVRRFVIKDAFEQHTPSLEKVEEKVADKGASMTTMPAWNRDPFMKTRIV